MIKTKYTHNTTEFCMVHLQYQVYSRRNQSNTYVDKLHKGVLSQLTTLVFFVSTLLTLTDSKFNSSIYRQWLSSVYEPCPIREFPLEVFFINGVFIFEAPKVHGSGYAQSGSVWANKHEFHVWNFNSFWLKHLDLVGAQFAIHDAKYLLAFS